MYTICTVVVGLCFMTLRAEGMKLALKGGANGGITVRVYARIKRRVIPVSTVTAVEMLLA